MKKQDKQFFAKISVVYRVLCILCHSKTWNWIKLSVLLLNLLCVNSNCALGRFGLQFYRRFWSCNSLLSLLLLGLKHCKFTCLSTFSQILCTSIFWYIHSCHLNKDFFLKTQVWDIVSHYLFCNSRFESNLWPLSQLVILTFLQIHPVLYQEIAIRL